jgi:hypothetical protein
MPYTEAAHFTRKKVQNAHLFEGLVTGDWGLGLASSAVPCRNGFSLKQ